MDAGMTGGAQGNQPARVLVAGPAVVDGQIPLRPTAAAAAAVARENRVAVAGEAPAGMRLALVAAPAQSGRPEPGVAAGTEKPGLPGKRVGRRRRPARGKRRLGRSICHFGSGTG
jgi:hypothetical protein